MDYPKITKTQVKFIQSLKQKKFRQKYQKYTIENHKVIEELLSFNAGYIDMIIGTDSYLEKFAELYESFDGDVMATGQKNIDMISQLKSPTQVVALCTQDKGLELDLPLKPGRYVYLETVQNPGNAGTIFRSADWFGYDGILLSPDSVEVFNQKLIQSSMGSFYRVPFKYVELEDLSDETLPIICTSMTGDDLADFSFPEHFILAMGNEGQGISEDLQTLAAHNIAISDSKKKGAESLNVAISSSIFMFQSVQ